MSTCQTHIAILLALVFCIRLHLVTADGSFELQFVGMENPSARLANGQCCSPSPSEEDEGKGSEECSEPCNTTLHVCLKEFQPIPKMDSRCSFGENTTWLGGHNETLILIPFNFTWNVSTLQHFCGVILSFAKACLNRRSLHN